MAVMSTFAWRRFADSRSTLARSSVASKKYTERLGDSAATPSRSIIQGRRLPGGRRNDLPTPFAFLHVDLAVASSPGRRRTLRDSFPELPTPGCHRQWIYHDVRREPCVLLLGAARSIYGGAPVRRRRSAKAALDSAGRACSKVMRQPCIRQKWRRCRIGRQGSPLACRRCPHAKQEQYGLKYGA